MSVIELCAIAALAVVFAAATAGKLRSRAAWDDFVDGLDQFGVPPAGRQKLAIAVVLAEVISFALLVLPVAPGWVRLVPAVGLLIGFSVAVAVAARRHPVLACHCFGSAGPTRVGPHLVVNGVLIVLGLAGIVTGGATPSAGATVLAVGLGLIAGAVALSAVPVLEAIGPQRMRATPAAAGRN